MIRPQRLTESLADVMRYIVEIEMEQEIDPSHDLYRTYLDLRDIFGQVKDHNETLDLETHDVFREPYSFEEKKEPYYYHPKEVANRKWREQNLV